MTNGSFPSSMTWPNEWPGQTPARGRVGQRAPKRDLGEREWKRLIQDALGEDNEIRFRQRVSEHLSTFGISQRAQRSKLREAVSIFREHRKGSEVVIRDTGGRTPQTESKRRPKVPRTIRNVAALISKAETKSPVVVPEDATRAADKKLAEEIYARVLTAGHVGLPPKKLHDLVVKHGSAAVARAIKAARRVQMVHGHLWIKERSEYDEIDHHHIGHTHDIAKAEGVEPSLPEQLPMGANQRPGAGQHNVTIGVSDKALPVGARKIWNRRVVEKKEDMRWHVVGHVAGLEDPSRVPQLDSGAIDRETLLHLLQQLLRIRQAHAKPEGDEQKDDSKVNKRTSAD